MSAQRELHEAFTSGSHLDVPPDLVPERGVRFLKNARLDHVPGAITSRPGLLRLTSVALGAAIRALHKRFASGGNSLYAQAGTALYRLPEDVSSSTLLSSGLTTTAVHAASMVDGEGGIWTYFANGAIVGKDNGTTLTTWGIAAPANPPSAVALAADLTTTIDALDAAASWTGAGLSAGPTDETNIKQEGTGSVTFTIAAGTLGSIGIGSLGGGTGYLDLDTLSGGDSSVKDDDYIHLWLRCDRPERVTYVQLDFDLDTQTLANAFRNNYYSVVLPGASRLNQGRDQWNRLQVRKSEFQRFGTDTSLSWASVKSARISALTTSAGAVQCYADDLKLRGGVDIEGEVEYTVAYRNSATGGRGNPPLDADGHVRYTTALTVNRQRVSLTISNVREGGADHSGDTQVDTLILYRRIDGGNSVNIAEIADTTASPYTDSITVLSTLLGDVLEDTADFPGSEAENDPPPATLDVVFGPGPFNRLFGLSGVNDLYFSKAWQRGENRVENWPPLNRLKVGSGSEVAYAGLATDTQVLVWTTEATYQILGSSAETFLAVSIPNSRGIIGRYALTEGDGRVFFFSWDGLYEQIGLTQRRLVDVGLTLLSAEINLTSDFATLGTVLHMAWHPDAVAPFVEILLATGTSTTANARLLVKKNRTTGQYTDVLLDTTTGFAITALLSQATNTQLYGGGSDGHIYLLEQTAGTDAGAAIAFQADTASHHQGVPTQDKQFPQVLVEGNTNGQRVSVAAYYDKRASSETLGTLATSSDTGDGRFTPSDPLAMHQDIALRFSGAVTSRVVIYRYGWLVEAQPEALTYWDSLVLSFALVETVRRFHLVLNAPALVTLQPYYDGVAGDALQTVPTSGKEYQVVWVPPSVKARTLRITLTSSTAFRLYALTCEVKPLRALQGYRLQPLVAGAA